MTAEAVPRRTSSSDGGVLDFPVLDRKAGPVGRLLSIDRHPVWTYIIGIVLSVAAIAGLSILAGVLVTRVLLHVHGLPDADESLVGFLARHRSTSLTDASLVGSIMAGGVVLPIVGATAALIALTAKKWRLAGFLLFTLGVESASYRLTTVVVHRHRPTVDRLEDLPVNASYPSGHTAASIAVYCGLALLLTSRMQNRAARIAVWTVAAFIPVFVAFSRLYRGMHHPIDVVGGALVGVAALSALVLVSRAAGSAARTSP